MLRYFSLVSPSVEWSATLIGIGLLVGLLFGFWLGTYLTVRRNPDEMRSLASDDHYIPPRKPTVSRAERKHPEK